MYSPAFFPTPMSAERAGISYSAGGASGSEEGNAGHPDNVAHMVMHNNSNGLVTYPEGDLFMQQCNASLGLTGDNALNSTQTVDDVSLSNTGLLQQIEGFVMHTVEDNDDVISSPLPKGLQLSTKRSPSCPQSDAGCGTHDHSGSTTPFSFPAIYNDDDDADDLIEPAKETTTGVRHSVGANGHACDNSSSSPLHVPRHSVNSERYALSFNGSTHGLGQSTAHSMAYSAVSGCSSTHPLHSAFPPPVMGGMVHTESMGGCLPMVPAAGSVTSPAQSTFTANSSATSATINDDAIRSNLFVCGLHLEVGDTDLYNLFAAFGTIESSKVMLDIHSGQSRGIAFVKFKDVHCAEKAMEELNGTTFHGQQIIVRVASSRAAYLPGNPTNKTFVRNVPPTVTRADLLRHFSQFGVVADVSIHTDTASHRYTTTGRSSGEGNKSSKMNIVFVTYTTNEAAAKAAHATHTTTPFPDCNGVPLLAKVAEDNARRVERLVRRYRPNRGSTNSFQSSTTSGGNGGQRSRQPERPSTSTHQLVGLTEGPQSPTTTYFPNQQPPTALYSPVYYANPNQSSSPIMFIPPTQNSGIHMVYPVSSMGSMDILSQPPATTTQYVVMMNNGQYAVAPTM